MIVFPFSLAKRADSVCFWGFRIGLLENPNGKKGIWKKISGGRKEALKEVRYDCWKDYRIFIRFQEYIIWRCLFLMIMSFWQGKSFLHITVVWLRANLERQYLSDRQDRYWVINDKALADHLSDCIEKLHSVCHVMTTVGLRPSEFVLDAHYEQNRIVILLLFGCFELILYNIISSLFIFPASQKANPLWGSYSTFPVQVRIILNWSAKAQHLTFYIWAQFKRHNIYGGGKKWK